MTNRVQENMDTRSFPSANQIAWLIPVTFLVHQIEEYLGQFPLWFSELLNAQLSNQDFIIINAAGLFVFTVFSLSYLFNRNNVILAALGTLIFVNGISHLLLSVFTLTYSPGTISGIVLFIPLGSIIFKKIFPKLSEGERVTAMALGIFVLFIVSMIAMKM